MKKIKLLFVTLIVLTSQSFIPVKMVEWKVKNDYSVKWDNGSFGGLKATIIFDEEFPEKSKISAIIDATSIKMGGKEGTEHAKEALETLKFPIIKFVAMNIIKKGESNYEATGLLTLKDITKEVKLPFFFNSKKDLNDKFPFFRKQTFCGKLTIIPKDFNVTRNGTPDQMIIELTIPVTQ